MPSTIHAAALCKMADRGQIAGGVLDGPLAFDNAVSPAAAAESSDAAPPDVQAAPPAPMQGLTRVGSGFVFSTVVEGHQVTAVGEVPAKTVEFIAESVKSFDGKQPARH